MPPASISGSPFGVPRLTGHVITPRTARRVAQRVMPPAVAGLRHFAVTGVVTPEFFADLAALYAWRRENPAAALDALVQYGLQQLPTAYPPAYGHRPAAGEL
jgi:hypothetical protein